MLNKILNFQSWILNFEFFFLDPIRDPIRDPLRDPIREPVRPDPIRSDPGFVDAVFAAEMWASKYQRIKSEGTASRKVSIIETVDNQ